MNKKSLFATISLAVVLMGAAPAPANSAAQTEIGSVSFQRCIENSKFGVAAQGQLEAAAKQMAAQIEAVETKLHDMQTKAQDPDFMDSLSPDAEKEMQMQFQQMLGQRQQMREQFFEAMKQGEGKLVQDVNIQAMRASQIVAKDKGLRFVVREESLFFHEPSTDFTDAVIAEMDKLFDKEMPAKPAEPAATTPAQK